MGGYLSLDPLLASPWHVRRLLEAGEVSEPYAYASNNPISRTDEEGLRDSQAKRDGEVNPTVRKMQIPLRRELSDKCEKEYEENKKMCAEKALKCTLPASTGSAPADAKQRDEIVLATIAAQLAECEKAIKCEREACLAGANSGISTTEYIRAMQRCMMNSVPTVWKKAGN